MFSIGSKGGISDSVDKVRPTPKMTLPTCPATVVCHSYSIDIYHLVEPFVNYKRFSIKKMAECSFRPQGCVPEVTTGMGMGILMGIPWNSHENGNN